LCCCACYCVLRALLSFPTRRSSDLKCTCKKLLCAINSSCCQEFLSADKSKLYSQLTSYEVLPSVASGEGKITGPELFFIGQITYQPCIFIIRMSSKI